ncbi:MAG: Hsp20/alpha crystallin family protein [Candidatus Omnitrophica bacterium]|nr:Hsp20/alpha crystallin family protein [Candidatus Omnitrophota bacterium]
MNLMRRNNKNEWLDPFSFLTSLHDDLDRFFAVPVLRSRGEITPLVPQIDVEEDANNYVLRADIPGIKKEELDISVQGNRLTLRGERKHERETKKDKNYYHCERYYGNFERTFEFPEDINPSVIKANYKDGVLEIAVPKSEEKKPKQIKVDIN